MNDQQSIRPFLAALEEDGALLRIPKEVDPAFELSAFLSAADAGPAVLFEKVKGSGLRIAGNLLNGRARIAAALGIAPADIVPRIHEAIRAPVKPVKVASGRVQDVVVTDNPLKALPVPRFFEREARHYITAGVILARDPHTGKGNASFARFAIHDGTTAMVGIAPNHHLALFSRHAAEVGKALPIVVVLGAHPAIQLAACLYLGVGDDELECAGSLLGGPVRVVPAKTVDLMVPADAEIVLEGSIDARQPLEEGFVSEYHGMYENYGPGFRATFSALTHAQDAIYQAIEPGYHREHIYLGALPIAASLRSAIAAVVPNVRDVAVTEAGAGRTDIVVQLETPRPGQARRAMFAAFAAVSLVKRVTVVDADIDPWDPVAVDWARVNRMRLERDLLLVPQAGTDRSEAMEDGGLVTKAGFDATAKAGDRAEGIERALPPQAHREAARKWLLDSLPAEKRRWLK
ncbi:MAG TPA: UbiD family decarboxylase [Reyranella sp.]|nr:UbiD family decarboxylase [Reyranella sp.]